MTSLKHPDALRIAAAAQRLEDMASGFGAEEFWQRDTRAPYGWSEAAAGHLTFPPSSVDEGNPDR